MSETNEVLIRRELSVSINIIKWVAFSTCILAILISITLIAIPGVLEITHKQFIIGVLFVFLGCLLVLVYKSQDDSRSLIYTSILAIGVSCLVIGFGAGQLVRHIL